MLGGFSDVRALPFPPFDSANRLDALLAPAHAVVITVPEGYIPKPSHSGQGKPSRCIKDPLKPLGRPSSPSNNIMDRLLQALHTSPFHPIEESLYSPSLQTLDHQRAAEDPKQEER